VSTPRYVAVANPAGNRWQAYARALEDFWRPRGVRPDVEVVPWGDVVGRDGNLDGLAAFDRPAVVRLESPGRDFEVSRLLLEAGGRAGAGPRTDWSGLEERKGRMVGPGLLYEGVHHVLGGLKDSFDRRPHLRPLACPLDVALMFDKNAAADRLEAAGVPCPPSLPRPLPADPEGLLARVREHHFQTAYVKLNTGSSAAAMAVLHAGDDAPWALSTLVRLAGYYHSTRRLRRLVGAELRGVLAFLLGEGACVQRGIRMAQVDGQNFDVRVVVLHGKPAFTVFRLNDVPITNLHLGGRRGDAARCRAAIPTRAWLDGLDHCVEAARQFRSVAVGVDLLFERGCFRPYVLEVNAFGDFFPGLVDAKGRGIHATEIEETALAFGLLS
jgi:hypothetical protein